MGYAAGTKVAPEKSRQQIEKLLKENGGTKIGVMTEETKALILVQLKDRHLRFVVKFPAESEFNYTPERRYLRTPDDRRKHHEQAINQRWRALLLIIKAKFEAIDSRIATFEEEFLPYVVLPSGQTVAELTLPQIAQIYTDGIPRQLLPG